MTDADAAGQVTRIVLTSTRNDVPTRITRSRRHYATDPADLWDAITNPGRLPRWFLPVTGDLQVGGRYALEGNASGLIEVCEPPQRLEITWEYEGEVSWVVATVDAHEDGAVLEISHEAPIGDGTFWTEFGAGAGGLGWDLGLLALAWHLDDANVSPEDAQAFPSTPEGIAFVTDAAHAWARAAIADGDDPAMADAAAARTIAAYTGQE